MGEREEKQREQRRVDRVIAEIKRQVAETTTAVEAAHKETRAVERNYSEDRKSVV